MSKPSTFERALIGIYTRVNRRTPWHKLPFLFGLFNLIALRDQLRAENLIDTRTPGDTGRTPGVALADAPDAERRFRTPDGSYNDLSDPDMGRAGTRFARNVPLANARPADMPGLMEPNPRLVSQKLMRRGEFTPATSINLLAASWIQFQTHDWFAHGREENENIEIPLPEGDGWFEDPMRIPRTRQDGTRVDADRDIPPTYINSQSHWWDASSIYGSSAAKQKAVRSFVDGKLVLKDGTLPLDPRSGVALTGFSENWWVGLGMLHTLFTLEHNAICDRLKQDYPHLTEDELFGTAQLINSALLAKIHTVEWTPAIIAHPVLKVAMRANWWGLAEEKLHRRFGRISKSDVISGIPGSPHNHHGAPYQLTEEFSAVYRLHPLLPEQLDVRSLEDDSLLDSMEFQEIILLNAQRVLEGPQSIQDLWYSFGVQNPGAVQLHNFPRWMQDLTLPDGVRLDLAALDIARDRERGVPRYNEFRRRLHLKPAATFAELTDNPVWAKELEEVYGDVEKVDLQVGMHAETPPEGFGFSDTAFRVFILMASRRLKSDRFITECYTEEYYTKSGLQWVADNTMKTVLLRHFPQLGSALEGVPNAFVPWNVAAPRTAPAAATAAVAQKK
ncbi:peroxidase family protein [Microbacterium sp. SS28]|uniref:peroxidase family protein n=1 Tax=Microbacterium sp. SS28 TaxID=2919948 RepID=UPI001FAA0466|nr:peroxidase family protein [Microbacterium sp. SS28]